MDVVGKDEEIVLRKGDKKNLKRNKVKETVSTSEVPTEKKKQRKSKEIEAISSAEVGGQKKVKGSGEKEGVSNIDGRERSGKRKRKKETEKATECSDVECATDQTASKGKDHINVGGEENVEYVKKGKAKNNKRNENGDDSGESCIEKFGGKAQSGSRSSKKRDREGKVLDVAIEEGKKKKKKKKTWTKLDANIENSKASTGDVEPENHFGSMDEHLRNSDSRKSSKRVKFASHVEVFPPSDDKDDQEENSGKELIRGKRFTKKEDQIIKDAVHNYIKEHNLGEEGLEMVMNCRKYPNMKACWREIGAALPYRPYEAVSQRGHTLLTRDESRTWTEDEKAFILKYYEKHGPDWKTMAEVLGKNRYHVHDTWRRISRASFKKGKWSQVEYHSLFNLVNKDLRMRVFEEKASSKHGMIRDNIKWQAISNSLATRTEMTCCMKWYRQLSSSMVGEGIWADIDDYRLLNELYGLDACCVEDVDWDNLLEHRPGDISLKRWRQMVNHIGIHGLQSFAEQVEVLAKRYCPELLEVKEAVDSRPSVD